MWKTFFVLKIWPPHTPPSYQSPPFFLSQPPFPQHWRPLSVNLRLPSSTWWFGPRSLATLPSLIPIPKHPPLTLDPPTIIKPPPFSTLKTHPPSPPLLLACLSPSRLPLESTACRSFESNSSDVSRSSSFKMFTLQIEGKLLQFYSPPDKLKFLYIN